MMKEGRGRERKKHDQNMHVPHSCEISLPFVTHVSYSVCGMCYMHVDVPWDTIEQCRQQVKERERKGRH